MLSEKGFEQNDAEVFALRALAWLLADGDLCKVFLGASGVAETDLRNRAEDPEFLAAVLDFLMMDDAWVVGFCDSVGAPYDRPMQARSALPGGADMHWT